MAIRPIFIPNTEEGAYVKTVMVDFQWFPGFSVSQKQKSIQSLHDSARETENINKILEISSKSPQSIGIELSAFNLMFTTVRHQTTMSVECAFQGSKVFSNGGPYTDIFNKTSLEAKRDERLKNSGNLISFQFFGHTWPLNPLTAFYDWLYINALLKNKELAKEIINYEAFTDIEFNPEKSINCQAYSAALYVSLMGRGVSIETIQDQDDFLLLLSQQENNNKTESKPIQSQLF